METTPEESFEELRKQFTPDNLKPSVVLNLDDPKHLSMLDGIIKWAPGLIPGAENEGITAGKFIAAPPRLATFDDSSWETPKNIRDVVGAGFTFAWYRFTIILPKVVKGLEVSGAQIWFETCSDDYGEVWIDCPSIGPEYRAAQAIVDNKLSPVAGYNSRNNVLVTADARPGTRHVIACLAINGPLAQPIGGVFIRYARLEICQGVSKIPI